MPQQEIAAGLERLVKAAQDRQPALLGKVHQHVHAEDAVDFPDVYRFDQIHLDERNHPPDARFHLETVLCLREVVLHLPKRHFLQAALGIDASFGVPQRPPTDVCGQNFDLPGLREFQRLTHRDRDRVRLLAGRAARAPDAERPRILPELALLHVRQDFRLESLVNRRIAKKRCLLRQQRFEQGLVLDARAAHHRQQFAAAGQSFFLEELPDARRKKPLAGGIEKNRRAILDQRSDLIELWLGEPRGRDWMLFHVRRSAPAETRRLAEFAASGLLPPAHSIVSLPLQPRVHRPAPTASGTARALRSVAPIASPCCRPCRRFASRPGSSAW